MKDKENLSLAYSAAVETMQERAASFYSAFSRLPKERFLGTAALYAFCRCADDLVDHAQQGEASETVFTRLDRLEQAVHDLYTPRGMQLEPVRDFIWWPAFADTVARFSIPPESFLEQIRGQRFDAAFPGIASEGDLIEYGRLVAGSVGTMMLPLLARDPAAGRDPGLRLACEHLGIGMQITNILRDVGEDLNSRGRLYLPKDLMATFGVSRETLEELAHGPSPLERPVPEAFIRLWEHLAVLADSYYEDYLPYLNWFHPDCRVPLAASALIYRAIADAVREKGYDCFTRRCYTDDATRARLFLQANELVLERSQTVAPSSGRGAI